MIKLLRTNIHDPKFNTLVLQLNAELSSMYVNYQEVFAPHNKLKDETFSLVAIQNEKSVGIGAYRVLKDENAVEIKRMFVPTNHRGKGISKLILNGLEQWAKENNFTFAKLETGTKNLAAISLYKKSGYKKIPPYEPYVGIEESLCFGKKLT